MVAPDFDLPGVHREIESLTRSVQTTILRVGVTRQRIIEEIDNKEYDVLWFASHASEEGVQLNDEVISVADLCTIVANSRCRVLVLNTCDAEIVGAAIHGATHVNVVAGVGKLEDASAYQAGVLFIRNLSRYNSVTDAYNASFPQFGRNIYRLFTTEQCVTNSEKEIRQALNTLEKKLNEIEQKLNALSKSIRLRPKTFSFVMAIFFLFLPVPLYYAEIRNILDIGWSFSFFLSIVSFLVSVFFWWDFYIKTFMEDEHE